MTLAKFNKLWRPGTGASLGFNIFIYPWVLIYLLYEGSLEKESLHLWIYLYGAMCTLFASLAGIRQFDKNKQHDVSRDINMASLDYYKQSANTDTPFSRGFNSYGDTNRNSTNRRSPRFTREEHIDNVD